MLDFDFNKEDSKYLFKKLYLKGTITVKRADFEEFLRATSDNDTDVGFYEVGVILMPLNIFSARSTQTPIVVPFV